MILNTGNRTDIPAFFSDWFFNRIQEGFVCVRNPYFPHQVTKYILDPQVIDIICFCTKNPKPMLSRLDLIKDYKQFWFVTITPYNQTIEPYVPNKNEIIRSFIELSKKIGSRCIGWRYDPIFLNDYYTIGGFTEVEGPGIVVKIEDGDYDINSDSQEEVNRRTLHDIDVAMIINELRYIGAEAIALNSYRILNNTGVTCNWAFIGFEDESMEMAPFYFYAIGNPEQLETAIKAEGSYINELIIRKLKIEVNVMESITVLPTKKSYDSLYMHRNDK